MQAWSWEATATLIQAVATVIALAGVALTFYLSLRAERRERERTQQEAERARAGAERAEHAAALGIDALTRIAESIEGLERRRAEYGFLAQRAGKAAWSLTHDAGDVYRLTNTGDAVAYATTVSTDASVITPDGLPASLDVPPGEGAAFRAEIGPLTTDATVTVVWAESPQDESSRRSWRYPLPEASPH
ncbi:hypothetical protein ASD65_01650 [Microbacterium sp. Root61]|uniref:hypothetical protein n=1 Tax=Microbacterium sp. Root61 TaxID=1736570 RepID=UPI0006F4E8AB|nr:hypothetical protein [Microbacterium sp. Root61]KRA23265.1 hypothetical protein ASD65_01650 [Microbacterium sp. Root61]